MNFSYTAENVTAEKLIKLANEQMNSEHLTDIFCEGEFGGELGGELGGAIYLMRPGKKKNSVVSLIGEPLAIHALTAWLNYWDAPSIKENHPYRLKNLLAEDLIQKAKKLIMTLDYLYLFNGDEFDGEHGSQLKDAINSLRIGSCPNTIEYDSPGPEVTVSTAVWLNYWDCSKH